MKKGLALVILLNIIILSFLNKKELGFAYTNEKVYCNCEDGGPEFLATECAEHDCSIGEHQYAYLDGRCMTKDIDFKFAWCWNNEPSDPSYSPVIDCTDKMQIDTTACDSGGGPSLNYSKKLGNILTYIK